MLPKPKTDVAEQPLDSKKKEKESKGSKGLASRIEFNPPVVLGEPGRESGQRIAEDIFADALDLETLNEMFSGDLSDIDEYDLTEITEAISLASRYKKRITIRRYKNKIAVSRRRALKRRAPQRTIQRRARRMAVSQMKRKFAQGRPTKSLSFSERSRIESMVKRRRPAVGRLQRKLVRTARSNETRRLHNSLEVEFSNVNMLFEVFQQLYEASSDLITLAVGRKCTISITKRAKKDWDKSKAPVQDTGKVLSAIQSVSNYGPDAHTTLGDLFKSEGRHPMQGGQPIQVWAFRSFQLRVYGGFVDGNRHFVITSVLIKKKDNQGQYHLQNVAIDLSNHYVPTKGNPKS